MFLRKFIFVLKCEIEKNWYFFIVNLFSPRIDRIYTCTFAENAKFIRNSVLEIHISENSITIYAWTSGKKFFGLFYILVWFFPDSLQMTLLCIMHNLKLFVHVLFSEVLYFKNKFFLKNTLNKGDKNLNQKFALTKYYNKNRKTWFFKAKLKK